MEASEAPAKRVAPKTVTTGAKRKRAAKEDRKHTAKFQRGDGVATKKLKDKKLRGKMRHAERLATEAAEKAAQAEEWLLPSEPGTLEAEGMERTWRFKQEDVVQVAQLGAGKKVFDLALTDLGPYSVDFSRSGRHLLLGGRKGHLAVMDWQRLQLVTEVQVRETTRAVKFLHNELFFAAAQKKYVYIYDRRGTEIHCLREHTSIRALDFLPYHFLLTSVGDAGILSYQDTSTGRLVAQHRTRLGACGVMRHNPWNAVAALGHANGVVSMWTPNLTVPAVKMLCHRGPVRAIAFDGTGHHMATAGADGEVKVWDVRTFRPLHAYFSKAPANSLDISQTGLLCVAANRRVQVWQNALSQKQGSPYMTHQVMGALQDARFCPYEDVLALGHGGGLSTMLVPGAGEPNFDSRVADPYQGRRARREAEVHSLLDKLQPELIVLDPSTIGQVKKEPREVREEREAAARAANVSKKAAAAAKNDAKTPMKGKNRPSRRFKKKQFTIIEEKKGDVRSRIREELAVGEAQKQAREPLESAPRALRRFYERGAPR